MNKHLMTVNSSEYLIFCISNVVGFFCLFLLKILCDICTLSPLGVKASLRRLHHPFGTPHVVQPGATFCLLHQSNYLNGYSKDRLMPLWVSYTIQPLVSPLFAAVFYL